MGYKSKSERKEIKDLVVGLVKILYDAGAD
jgi:hypothetical protein